MALRLASVAALASGAAAGFVHPGVLADAGQWAFAVAQAKANVMPFNKSLHDALEFTWINGRTTPAGPPENSTYGPGVIACGYFDHPDFGCAAEGTDSQVALLQAMLWATTGNASWARSAMGIMDHYAANLRGYYNWENGPLEAAWAAQKWARAAEIINSTFSWPNAAAFGQMLQTYSVPMLWNGSCDNGNWELAMIEGLASIGVFTENATLFNRAIDMWRTRVPAYFYMATDGPAPLPGPARCGKPWWFDQVVFNASVNGVAQETCRDFTHTAYGIASTFNVAETARIQGVDLYAEQAPRLAAALEFHAGFLNQGGHPLDKNATVSSPLVCNGTRLSLSTFPTYQVGLAGMSRLKFSLPQTTSWVQGVMWPAYYNFACSGFMSCYESLTHGAAAPPPAY